MNWKQKWVRVLYILIATVLAAGWREPYQKATAKADTPYDFTFVWMSDTQYYSESYPEIYDSMVKWIANNKKELKIKYAIHTGDLVNQSKQENQWKAADRSMSVLEKAGIPYGVLAGNHDVGYKNQDYAEFRKWFGANRFVKQPTFGESYNNNRGHYDLISSNGTDLIIVYMGWGVGDPEIEWMNKALAKYPKRKAILAFHEYMLTSGKRSEVADRIYKKVVLPNRNVIAVLSGHFHDAELKTDAVDDNNDGTADRDVYQMLADYQEADRGGSGYIRMLQFDLKNNKLHVKTYSPYLNDYNYFEPELFPGKDEFSLTL
ncbi:metallophosphoesterase [Paenibacillus caui]|uniref:metallophosphoesterase n=1 Tax=Paenibacillus caui TaxID=2873927 RepID=UPI001F1DF133|nr:metallophosphoesterase [Paenibacillus caui]